MYVNQVAAKDATQVKEEPTVILYNVILYVAKQMLGFLC